jgi:hypothetical protein
MNATTEAAAPESWSIGDLEPVLGELRATIGILGHMIDSPNKVEIEKWKSIEGRLLDAHNELDALWACAWAQSMAERKAHEEALALAKARTAAPGSPADLAQADSIWSILRSTVKVAAQACEEARPALSGLAALTGRPLRVCDLPEDPDAQT